MENIKVHKPNNGPKSNRPDSAGAFGNEYKFSTNKVRAIRLPVQPNILLKFSRIMQYLNAILSFQI